MDKYTPPGAFKSMNSILVMLSLIGGVLLAFVLLWLVVKYAVRAHVALKYPKLKEFEDGLNALPDCDAKLNYIREQSKEPDAAQIGDPEYFRQTLGMIRANCASKRQSE
jgi:hypothetical protein